MGGCVGWGASAAQEQAQNGAISKSEEVNISIQARLRVAIETLPETRRKKIEEVRREIESGTYETEEKIDIAIDRILNEIT